jgi:hypothetical protein
MLLAHCDFSVLQACRQQQMDEQAHRQVVRVWFEARQASWHEEARQRT